MAKKENAELRNDSTRFGTEKMGTESITKLLFKFGIPAIATILINSMYNMVDRIFVSNGVGYVALSAISLTSPITWIMQALAMLIGVGGHTIFAMRLGEKDYKGAESVLGNTLAVTTVFSIIKFAIGMIFLEPILVFLGAEGETLTYAIDYMRIIMLGTLFSAISNGMNNFVNTSGNPTMGMICLAVGCAVNVVLDPVFIFIFDWGVKGAAIATIIAQCISACMVLGYFAFSKKPPVKLYLRDIRINIKLSLQSMKLGVASALSQASSGIVGAVINKTIVIYGAAAGAVTGDIVLSAVSATTSTGMVFVIPAFGLQQAVQSLAGYNFGAKNYHRVKELVKKGLVMGLAVTMPGYIILHLFTGFFVSLYGNADNATFVEYAKWCMHVYNLTVPFLALHSICTGYFLSSGQALKATVSSLIRTVSMLPLTLIMPMFLGVNGCIIATPVSDVLGFIVAMTMLIFDMKRLDGLIAGQERLPDTQSA